MKCEIKSIFNSAILVFISLLASSLNGQTLNGHSIRHEEVSNSYIVFLSPNPTRSDMIRVQPLPSILDVNANFVL